MAVPGRLPFLALASLLLLSGQAVTAPSASADPLPFYSVAVPDGKPGATFPGTAPGFHNQRYAAPRLPGRTVSTFRQLTREHDAGRRQSGEDVRLTRDISIRQGRAYLFRSRSDDFPQTEFAGSLGGKGAYFTITWPPD